MPHCPCVKLVLLVLLLVATGRDRTGMAVAFDVPTFAVVAFDGEAWVAFAAKVSPMAEKLSSSYEARKPLYPDRCIFCFMSRRGGGRGALTTVPLATLDGGLTLSLLLPFEPLGILGVFGAPLPLLLSLPPPLLLLLLPPLLLFGSEHSMP